MSRGLKTFAGLCALGLFVGCGGKSTPPAPITDVCRAFCKRFTPTCSAGCVDPGDTLCVWAGADPSYSQHGCYDLCLAESQWPDQPPFTRCAEHATLECAVGKETRLLGCDAPALAAAPGSYCTRPPSLDPHGCPPDRPAYYKCGSDPQDHPPQQDCTEVAPREYCCVDSFQGLP